MFIHLVCAPVDECSPLYVRREEGVNGVFLGKLTVHAHHGSLQNKVRVGQVGDRLVNADWPRRHPHCRQRKLSHVTSRHHDGRCQPQKHVTSNRFAELYFLEHSKPSPCSAANQPASQPANDFHTAKSLVRSTASASASASSST